MLLVVFDDWVTPFVDVAAVVVFVGAAPVVVAVDTPAFEAPLVVVVGAVAVGAADVGAVVVGSLESTADVVAVALLAFDDDPATSVASVSLPVGPAVSVLVAGTSVIGAAMSAAVLAPVNPTASSGCTTTHDSVTRGNSPDRNTRRSLRIRMSSTDTSGEQF